MIALVQRVTEARVAAGGQITGEIGAGILALIGVQKGDTDAEALRLLERLLGYRLFADAEGRMNRSLTEVSGGLLLVPQFTLAADTRKGTRASFSSAAPPAYGERLFNHFTELARTRHGQVETGRFHANCCGAKSYELAAVAEFGFERAGRVRRDASPCGNKP